jgi:hypothetical protein
MRKLEKHTNEVVQMYKNGSTLAEISEKFNVSSPTVGRCLDILSVNRRTLSESCSTYKYNIHFFDNIDTEQKAYVLGFYYGDGYNYENKNNIAIRITDYEILDKIRTAMESNHPFHILNQKKRTADGYARSETYVFALFGKHISQALAEKGCPQAKSKTLTMPSQNTVPKHLINHFVRGYFDADGSIFKVKRTERLGISIIGTRTFLDEMAKYLPCKTFIRDRKYTEMSDLRIGKQQDIQEFKKWLYKDSTIHLERKEKIFNLEGISFPRAIISK